MTFFLLDTLPSLWYNSRSSISGYGGTNLKFNMRVRWNEQSQIAKARMQSILATSELASEVADTLDANLISHAGVVEQI